MRSMSERDPIRDLFEAFNPPPPSKPLQTGWWRGWGCHIGPLWFVWHDLWTDRHGLLVTWESASMSSRRLLNIGSRAWRND
jgi:hypothetical protein